MQVILKEDVRNLGKAGEIVNVKDGYGRNFLLPRGLAIDATAKNIRQLEHQKNVIIQRAKKLANDAKSLADRISQVSVTIYAKAGEEDRLFGSVTSNDISEALKQQGLDIDKKKIIIEEPIKRLGEHSVKIKLHPEISATLKVFVNKEEQQT
ncbi:MAG: 50S ribosomal protein L9 [Thermodesulfovibrionales bacterium]